jgi:hypothetical protein
MLCYLIPSFKPPMHFLFVSADQCGVAYFRPAVAHSALASCFRTPLPKFSGTSTRWDWLSKILFQRTFYLYLPFRAHTRVWQKWRFSAPQTHLGLIQHLFSASKFMVKIATFAKPENVKLSKKPISGYICGVLIEKTSFGFRE